MNGIKEVLCITDFVEDSEVWWSEGCYYEVVGMDGENYRIQHNFGGVGYIYAEDFDIYFKVVA